MRRDRAQMAVVMDEHGGTAGLVTMEDLFEEVVGDIDEGRGRAAIVRESDGNVRVRGTVRLEEVGQGARLAARTSQGDHGQRPGAAPARTSGHLGDVVTWNQVRVEVTKVAGRGVAERAAYDAERSCAFSSESVAR